MKKTLYLSFILLFLTFTFTIMAQETETNKKEKGKKGKKGKKTELSQPSITQHQIIIDGKTIDYTATTGYLTLKKENGDARANIFYIAYTKNDVKNSDERPLTFSFNGGPGSSSVWLHLGVLGPKRVLMTDEGETLPPPYQLVDNDFSWLDLTDMVFIDPVSTGFSRAEQAKKAGEFHGYKGDVESVGDFVRRYVSENERWISPKFVIGESYGTTRAAGLSNHLINRYGMYLNGVILVSAVTNMQTIRFAKGNDLPNILFLPTYTASAYYHKKLSDDLLSKDFDSLLTEVENFAIQDYNVALMKGDLLEKEEKQRIAAQLATYTGLDESYIMGENLRLNIHKFTKELLRDSLQVIGRFDSRYKASDVSAHAEYGEKDPSYQPTIHGCFSNGINDLLTRTLKFKTHLPYEVLTGRVRPWKWNADNKYLNTSEYLRKAMNKNPHMKVWVANGYYDLATPYFATEYTINHMGLSPELKNNINMTYYPAGHMMYLLKESLVQMKADAKAFFTGK